MSDSDAVPAPVPVRSAEAFHHTLTDYDALNASLRDGDKAALFSALAAVGITHVIVSFDGYGDSGQIEGVTATAGDASVDLPDTTVAIAAAEWGSPEPVTHTMPIADAVEHLAYDCLGAAHSGWQDGDGTFGEFVFDIAAGTITLDYDERYTATNNYTHAF